jgi:putative phosphoesterase
MKIGLAADAHGDVDALRTALDELDRREVETILLAGDALNSYHLRDEVIDLIRERHIRYVAGNHERSLLRWSKRQRGRPDNWQFLEAVPSELRLELGGRRLLMVHGSPWPPHDDYLDEHHPALTRAPELAVDYLVLGHTHVPMYLTYGATTVVNPGSVAEKRGRVGKLTCAVLETDTGDVEFVTL